jgi:hypothetical protein
MRHAFMHSLMLFGATFECMLLPFGQPCPALSPRRLQRQMQSQSNTKA